MLYIGSVSKIPVYLHWSLSLFLLLIPANNIYQFIFNAFIILLIFSCVFLHELGHCALAQYHGVMAEKITLFIFGGVALIDIPTNSNKKEFWITLGGPAVNACLIFIGLAIQFSYESYIYYFTNVNVYHMKILYVLQIFVLINCFMFVFNMMPAFPMDGGRIFRSLLQTFCSKTTATNIATSVGIIFGFIFIAVAIWKFIIGLFFIGLLVIFLSIIERQDVYYENK